MRSLFAPVRVVFVTAALALGLGCSGAMNGAMQLAGVDMQLNLGANAVHPDDFPAKPPTKGEKAMSMRFTALGESINIPPDIQLPEGVSFTPGTEYTLDIVVYTVEGADLLALCDTAKEQVAAESWSTKDPGAKGDPEIKEVALFGKDQDLFAVMGTDDGESASLVLLRIHPDLPEGAAPAEAVVEPEGEADAPDVDEEGQQPDQPTK